MLRFLTSLASVSGRNRSLTTFIFHRVHANIDPMSPGEPDAKTFDSILGWIGEQFRVLAPLEACERLAAGDLPRRSAVITFDDGYLDNHDVALPILERHGVKAAFFVATGYLEGGLMFNDRVVEAVRGYSGATLKVPSLELPTLPTDSAVQKGTTALQIVLAIRALHPVQRLAAVEEVERTTRAGPLPRLMIFR